MTSKQLSGLHSPTESVYVTFTDGKGNLIPSKTHSLKTTIKLKDLIAPDGSLYVTPTNGSGTLV